MQVRISRIDASLPLPQYHSAGTACTELAEVPALSLPKCLH